MKMNCEKCGIELDEGEMGICYNCLSEMLNI